MEKLARPNNKLNRHFLCQVVSIKSWAEIESAIARFDPKFNCRSGKCARKIRCKNLAKFHFEVNNVWAQHSDGECHVNLRPFFEERHLLWRWDGARVNFPFTQNSQTSHTWRCGVLVNYLHSRVVLELPWRESTSRSDHIRSIESYAGRARKIRQVFVFIMKSCFLVNY